MCTVTYIPTISGCIITSNRDEKISREKAIPPSEYLIGEKKIIFPKDPKAGGTWIAHSETKIVVLLNGAKEKHIPKTIYKKSRGLVVLELISAQNSLSYWNSIHLNNIEPFTIIIFENNCLFQLEWDEIKKRSEKLDETQFYIWSSSTLYNQEIKKIRKTWFMDFMRKNNNPCKEKILSFHQFTKKENKKYGLQINHSNLLKTVSISQCEIKNNRIEMYYLDLID